MNKNSRFRCVASGERKSAIGSNLRLTLNAGQCLQLGQHGFAFTAQDAVLEIRAEAELRILTGQKYARLMGFQFTIRVPPTIASDVPRKRNC